VTVSRASVEQLSTTSAMAFLRNRTDLESRPLATLGNALSETPAMVQQSTTGQVSPFLRGLTGYQVLNLIDGVRFNNSTFRSGPNQYLAFIDPSQVDAVEATLGPAGVEYGSGHWAERFTC
jgi:hemoglobin/transferrin/lactoferrin receptor protein